MSILRTTALVCLALTIVAGLALAQPGPLNGSSSFEVNLGLWNQVQAGQQISINGIKQSAKTNGFVGGIGYSYWMREYLSVTVEASLLSSEASTTLSTSNIGQRANSVVSFLLGMKCYLPQPEPEDRVRPFVAVAVGSYIGSEVENSLLSQSAHSESVIGGRVGVGLDAFLGTWFKLGANVGYNVMSDFKTPVGARSNFNGYDMSIGFGFYF
jgi:hypothetical protein